MEQNTLLIVGAVVVVLFIILLMPWGSGCSKCGEGFDPSQSAQFQVKRTKYPASQNYPVQSAKEGFMAPHPTEAQIVSHGNKMKGGMTSPLSNPWMGGLEGEVVYGTSIPGTNSASLLLGNGAGNAGATSVWKTII